MSLAVYLHNINVCMNINMFVSYHEYQHVSTIINVYEFIRTICIVYIVSTTTVMICFISKYIFSQKSGSIWKDTVALIGYIK